MSIRESKRMSYPEIMKGRRQLKQLHSEKRRFERALKDEGNSKAMDDFCLRGLNTIQARIEELNSRGIIY